MNNKGLGRGIAWFKNILDDGNPLDLVAVFFIVNILLPGKDGRRKGRESKSSELRSGQLLAAGTFFCLHGQENERITLRIEEKKQGRDFIAIRAIISTFVMNSQGQEKGKQYETPIVVQEQGSKIDELATANTDPAIRQRK